MAFAIRGRMDGKDKTMICFHCKCSGHEADSCFAFIGYLEWWGDRPRIDRKNGGRGKGHQPSQQRTEKGACQGLGTVRINAAQATIGSLTTTSTSDGNEVGSLGLSNDQLQVMLKLINSQKNSATEKMTGKQVSWIIDTGASNHMTGTLSDLHNLWKISPYLVSFPDGSNAVATNEGSIILDGDSFLENVLYVPRLTCNLISVSQLIDHSNCIVDSLITCV